jgi:hypothetical protein
MTLLGIGAAEAVLTHLPELYSAQEQYLILRVMFLVESAVTFALFIFLFALAVFMVWYPVTIRKNLLVYSFSFSLMFAANTAGLLARNINPGAFLRAASTARLAVYSLCLLAMAALLRAAWETQARPALNTADLPTRERLLAQLNRLNGALDTGGRPRLEPR